MIERNAVSEIVSPEAKQEILALADSMREEWVRAALKAYENARMDGLCHEGAWEVAIGAIQNLDVRKLVERAGNTPR